MNRKPFNEIEEQMRASAEGWEPAYDEQAWERMEKMLDKEDDRRRPFAWWIWLLPVMLGIGIAAYLFTNKNGQTTTASVKPVTSKTAAPNTNAGIPAKTKKSDASLASDDGPVATNGGNTATGPVSASLPIQGDDKSIISFVPQKIQAKTKLNWSSGSLSEPRESTGANNTTSTNTVTDKRSTKTTVSPPVTGIPLVAPPPAKTTEASFTAKTAPADPVTQAKPNQKTATVETIKEEKNTTNTASQKITPEKKQKDKALSKFYFGLSGGMDANGVHFPGLDKFTARAGFTVGYQLNRHISVATGFFTGSKKYVAGKNDYKAKPGTYWAMVDIKEVDADCRVFEIPLMLRYDFNSKGKLKPFASLGLSSYIMDKEDYEYYYYRLGNPYRSEHSYKGNRHLFSVLKIAGGIEKKLSPDFSLSVQPGLSVPLKGVGEGQIKLYSTELLLGLKYRPFKKNK